MRRTMAAEALLAATAAGMLYARTLAPGVGAGDRGELLLAAESLGVPHPPGYPLWTLLARLAAAIPGGTLAWRVNALSALLGAIAVGLLYIVARRFGAGRFGSAVAAGLFTVSIPVWRVAVEAEVYGLAAVAFLVLLLAARNARTAGTRGVRADAIFGFTAGLAFLAHQTLAAPAIVLAVWVLRRGFAWKRFAHGAAWLAVGLTPAAIVPWRVSEGAALLWKERGPLQALGDVFTRQAYGAVAQNPWRLDLVVGDLTGMAGLVARGVGVLAVLLGAVAVMVLLRRRRARGAGPLGWPVLAALSIPAALAMLLVFTPDAEHLAQVEPFLLPLLAVVSLLAGTGAAWFVRRARGLRFGPFLHPASAAPAIIGIALVTTGALHFAACDRSGFDLPERYGRELLAAVPAGATLIVDGDNETFLAAYLIRHEGLRPDLTLVHRRGCVFGDANRLASRPRSEWAALARAADLERIADRTRAVYFADAPEDLEQQGVRFRSSGLVSRALPPGSVDVAATAPAWIPPATWARSTDLLGGHPERYDFVTRKLAVSYSDAAARAYLARGEFAPALAWFEDAASVGFDMPEAQWNVAVTAAAFGDPDRALDALLAARSMAPSRAESASRLALFLSSAGRHADAARWFERAFRTAPSAALAEDAARAWRLAGDPARAQSWRDRAATTARIG